MEPTFSPWGEVQWCDEIYNGVYMLGTASHGGILIERSAVTCLTPAARKCGFYDGSYLCFEEDCQELVVLRDLLDSGLWKVPADRIKDIPAFEASINGNIQEYNPTYWKARERRMKKIAAKQNERRSAPHPR
jgi:hypothetical protein